MISFKLFKEGYTSGTHELSPEQLADHAEHGKTLSERNIESIKDYKRQSSYWNNPLRHKGNDRASYDRAYTGALHGNQMDPAADRAKEMDPITNHPMKHNTILYRSFQDHSHDMMRTLKMGDTFTDHGYIGTTTNPKVAKQFAQPIRVPGTEHQHVGNTDSWTHHYAEIHAPAGTRGHYLDMHGGHSHDEENEVLLHRGTKFQVTHHTEHMGDDAYGGKHVDGKPVQYKFHVTHLRVVGNENV